MGIRWSLVSVANSNQNDKGSNMEIEIHKLTQTPTAAWKEISNTQRVIKLQMQSITPEIPKDKIRVVCMSDTHSATRRIKFDIPDGDIFIHAGDFTGMGQLEEVISFNKWIGTLPHKYKIVIAGNHELSFDESIPYENESFAHRTQEDTEATLSNKKPSMKDYLTNCTYLEDSSVKIYGLKIYGAPWQPQYGSWAFNVPRGRKILDKWDLIPSTIDILITHGPPIGHGDLCNSGVRAGCVELLASIQKRIKPKFHVFGHIHEGYGITSDGNITYINASTCNIRYQPVNPPIVFDMSLPAGNTKD